MSSEEKSQGSIYYVIPAQVFEDSRLEDSEKVFYGLLSGLAHSNGFCFASDAYLASRKKVDERTIKRWLEKLEKIGYIKRETKKNGMYWDRKIFITHSYVNSNKCYERAPKSLPKGRPCPDRSDAHVPIESEAIPRASLEKKESKTPPPHTPPKKKKEEELATPLKEEPPTELEMKNAETKLASRRKRVSEPVHDEEAWKKAHIARERKKLQTKESKAEADKQGTQNLPRQERIYNEWVSNPNAWLPNKMEGVQGILYGRFLINGEFKLVPIPETDEELATWKK